MAVLKLPFENIIFDRALIRNHIYFEKKKINLLNNFLLSI